MPTVGQRLRQVTLKVERAKEHVANTERELRAFYDTQPYRIGTNRDPQTGKLVYYLTCAHPTPDRLAIIAGDAVQNLMSALDHLAYQLVCSDTSDNPPNRKWIFFPIADTIEIYEAKKGRKIEGALPDTIAAIDALKPNKGGNDLLWSLYRLNNIEKHRLLLTVGSQTARMNFGQYMVHSMRKHFGPAALEQMASSINFQLVPTDKDFPLKDGTVLLIGTVEDEPNPNQEFSFEVALNEPGIIEGKPLLETLHLMTTLVEGIVTALSPRLV